jgi:hypothetical protein
MKNSLLLFLILTLPSLAIEVKASNNYPWLKDYQKHHAIVNRIAVPSGFERVFVPSGSFADWLRHLPLKPGKPPVYLHNGRKKRNQLAHHAVVDIDVGTQDLQQCADAIIRLRAEYFYSIKNYSAIHFNFTSGDEASYQKWIAGYRPSVRGNNVKWRKTQRYDKSHRTFRKYTNTVFMYAGSYSLSLELKPVKSIKDMKIGDVFIKGGFPGHAIIVVDMAIHKTTGKKIFLLAQSYMPAQDVHILNNPTHDTMTPWYELDFGEKLYTPEWTFSRDQLKTFFEQD